MKCMLCRQSSPVFGGYELLLLLLLNAGVHFELNRK